MLAGHYAAAYALRAARPIVPLWMLFLAVQAVDVLFFVFAVAGVETLEVAAGGRGPLAMNLVHIPYTHSLVMTAIYAAAIVIAGGVMRRAGPAVIVALALISHWILDVFVHTPDLPLTVASTDKVGLGLWRYPAPALLLEVGLVLVAYAALRRLLPTGLARRWAAIGAAVLVVTQLIYVFGPPPASVMQMAVSAEAIYLVMTLFAYQVDRHSR